MTFKCEPVHLTEISPSQLRQAFVRFPSTPTTFGLFKNVTTTLLAEAHTVEGDILKTHIIYSETVLEVTLLLFPGVLL